MPLTHSDVAEILKIIDASALDEVVVEVGDLRVEVRRRGGEGSKTSPIETRPAASPADRSAAEGKVETPPANPPTPAPAATSSPRVTSPAGPSLAPGQVAICSPMVGTFYRRPSPEQPPFVEVGEFVEVGAALCLVEVMKLFTTVYAESSGRIAAICATDGNLVEYDQVLFVLDPS